VITDDIEINKVLMKTLNQIKSVFCH